MISNVTVKRPGRACSKYGLFSAIPGLLKDGTVLIQRRRRGDNNYPAAQGKVASSCTYSVCIIHTVYFTILLYFVIATNKALLAFAEFR